METTHAQQTDRATTPQSKPKEENGIKGISHAAMTVYPMPSSPGANPSGGDLTIQRKEATVGSSASGLLGHPAMTNYPIGPVGPSQSSPIQRQAGGQSPAVGGQAAPNQTGLPDNLKSGIESLSGMDMSDVKVHYNSSKPAQLKARAYAQGTDIHLGPGQSKHLPHEAWHVAQQKQGRVQPTMQLKNAAINDDSKLEREADVMGARAMQTTTKPDSVQPSPIRALSSGMNEPVIQGKLAYSSFYPKEKRKYEGKYQRIDVEKLIKQEGINDEELANKLRELDRIPKRISVDKSLNDFFKEVRNGEYDKSLKSKPRYPESDSEDEEEEKYDNLKNELPHPNYFRGKDFSRKSKKKPKGIYGQQSHVEKYKYQELPRPWRTIMIGHIFDEYKAKLDQKVLDVFLNTFGVKGKKILTGLGSDKKRLVLSKFVEKNTITAIKDDYSLAVKSLDKKEVGLATQDYYESDSKDKKKRIRKQAKESTDDQLSIYARIEAGKLRDMLLGDLAERAADKWTKAIKGAPRRDKQLPERTKKETWKFIDNQINTGFGKQALSLAKDAADNVIKEGTDKWEKDGPNIPDFVKKKNLGEKTLKGFIEANSAEEGMGMFGRFLDDKVRAAGTQAAFEVVLRIYPLGGGSGPYIQFALSGSAGRGIEGFSTAGYPSLAEKANHLEVNLGITVTGGIGMDVGVFNADFNIGVTVFLRSGADDTNSAIKALQYGWYQLLTNTSESAANKLFGGTAAKGKRLEQSEKWAAMVEEQVFKDRDDSFVDFGYAAKAGASIETDKAFKGSPAGWGAGIELGFDEFRHFDQETIKKSLGGDFASVVKDKKAAKSRRKKKKSEPGKSIFLSGEASAAGQSFGLSISAAKPYMDNIGIGISWTVGGIGGGKSTDYLQIAAGIVAVASSAIEKVQTLVKNKGKGNNQATKVIQEAVSNIGAMVSTISWLKDKNELESILAKEGTANEASAIAQGSAGLGVTFTIGRDGGENRARLDLTESTGFAGALNFGYGSLGVEYSKSKILLAIAYEHGNTKIFGGGNTKIISGKNDNK